MNSSELLTVLKSDLQMVTPANDQFLGELLGLARKLMQREGVAVDDNNIEHQMVQVQYAAYLFRRRGGSETAMPRFLRYELNNLVMSQKGNANDV